MNKHNFTFTREHLAHFADARARGLSKNQACDELGHFGSFINRKAKAAGLFEELQKIYSQHNKVRPTETGGETFEGIQRVLDFRAIPMPELDTSSLHVRAAVTAWRKTA